MARTEPGSACGSPALSCSSIGCSRVLAWRRLLPALNPSCQRPSFCPRHLGAVLLVAISLLLQNALATHLPFIDSWCQESSRCSQEDAHCLSGTTWRPSKNHAPAVPTATLLHRSARAKASHILDDD